MNDDNRELNIAIPLSEEVNELVTEMQKTLRGEAELVYEFGDKASPHITLYSVEYPPENEERVVGVVREIARESQSMTIKLTEVVVQPEYVEVMVEKSDEVMELHKTVMERLNPMRDGHLREKYGDPEFLENYSSIEHENIRRWGRPLVGPTYVPHISVGRRVDGGVFDENIVSWEPREMRVENLIVGRGGAWGTIVEVLERVELTSKS